MDQGLLHASTPDARSGRRQDRAEPRAKVFLLASLRRGEQKDRAHLLDLSPGGARVHCAVAPRPAESVELVWGPIRMRGMVMWVRDDRFGVRFDRRLSPIELESAID